MPLERVALVVYWLSQATITLANLPRCPTNRSTCLSAHLYRYSRRQMYKRYSISASMDGNSHVTAGAGLALKPSPKIWIQPSPRTSTRGESAFKFPRASIYQRTVFTLVGPTPLWSKKNGSINTRSMPRENLPTLTN